MPDIAHILLHQATLGCASTRTINVCTRGAANTSRSSMTYFFAERSSGVGPRVGLTAGRVLGKAVDRNRIKRRMREAVRLNLALLTRDVDVVLHPRRSVLTADFPDCKAKYPGSLPSSRRRPGSWEASGLMWQMPERLPALGFAMAAFHQRVFGRMPFSADMFGICHCRRSPPRSGGGRRSGAVACAALQSLRPRGLRSGSWDVPGSCGPTPVAAAQMTPAIYHKIVAIGAFEWFHDYCVRSTISEEGLLLTNGPVPRHLHRIHLS